jgi:hypothetical protein
LETHWQRYSGAAMPQFAGGPPLVSMQTCRNRTSNHVCFTFWVTRFTRAGAVDRINGPGRARLDALRLDLLEQSKPKEDAFAW